MAELLDKEATLHSFWSSFGIPAYDENTVVNPATGKTPEPPYITYDVITDNLGNNCYMSAILWYRDSSWAEITNKSQEISNRFGYSGISIPIQGGYIWIKRGNPFAQRGNDPNDQTIRRILLNIVVEYLTES